VSRGEPAEPGCVPVVRVSGGLCPPQLEVGASSWAADLDPCPRPRPHPCVCFCPAAAPAAACRESELRQIRKATLLGTVNNLVFGGGPPPSSSHWRVGEICNHDLAVCGGGRVCAWTLLAGALEMRGSARPAWLQLLGCHAAAAPLSCPPLRCPVKHQSLPPFLPSTPCSLHDLLSNGLLPHRLRRLPRPLPLQPAPLPRHDVSPAGELARMVGG
jgi:hypothetical protein